MTTTYSKLFCCIGSNAEENKFKTKIESPINRSLTRKPKQNEESSADDYPHVETIPSSFEGSGLDALGLLELRLHNTQLNYMKKIIYWRNQKLNLMAENALQEEVVNIQHNKRETLARLLQELKGLFQFADGHLRDVYQRTAPTINLIEDNLCKSFEKLEKLPQDSNDPDIKKEDAKLRLDICNNSINMLTSYTSLINDVSREIKMCVKLEEIIEKATIFLLDVIMLVFVPIPIPRFNFNFSLGGLYRNFLFSEVQPEVARIENLVSGSEACVTKAKDIISQKQENNVRPGEGYEKEEKTVNAETKKERNLDRQLQPGHEQFFPQGNNNRLTNRIANRNPLRATMGI